MHNGVHFKFVNYHDHKLRFPLKLHRLIKRLQPDVVVVHGLHNPWQVLQLRLHLDKNTKIIAQNHAEKPFNGLKKQLQKIADNYIDAYLFASKGMGLDWVNKGNLASPEKIHEVMEVSSAFYPINKTEAKAKTNAQGDVIFLWVGRLDENKDPLTVVKAFLKFAATNATARLYMIYHTEELLQNIKELLTDKANEQAITLIGKVPNDDMLYWYNSADFIISGSHYEGSGTAVCEAMSCGCIPIVTDIFSFRMITDDGQIGRLYPAGDEASLLKVLNQTKQIDTKLERDKALAYFESNLSFKAIAQKIMAVASSL